MLAKKYIKVKSKIMEGLQNNLYFYILDNFEIIVAFLMMMMMMMMMMMG